MRSQRERFMERVFLVGEGLLFVLIHQIGKYEINTTSSSVALYRYANTLCFDLRKVKRLCLRQPCVSAEVCGHSITSNLKIRKLSTLIT